MMAVIVMELEKAEALRDFCLKKLKPNGSIPPQIVIEAVQKMCADLGSMSRRREGLVDSLEGET